MANITFDDGEPIDITKLQDLYRLILALQGELNAMKIQTQSVKLTPLVFANKITNVSINDVAKVVTKLDYSIAKFDANAIPTIVVTPSASSTNLDTTDIQYYVTNVTSSSADLIAKYIGTAKSKTTTASFNFIAVHMKQTLQ